MHSLLQDARFSLRMMRKHPGMSLLVLAALVLGIGVNSAVFSVVNSVLLRPVPLSDAERLAFIFTKSQKSSLTSLSYPEYRDWKAQSRSFQDMTAFKYLPFNLKGNGPPEHLIGLGVTASYFKIVGISLALGRDFTSDDERPGAARVAVLSYGLWQRRFGGDPAILGKTMVLDSQIYSIVGVLSPIEFPLLRWDVWVGIGPFLDEHMMNRETRHFLVIGRLAPSADRAQAQKEMEIIAARLAAQYPQSNKDITVTVEDMVDTYTSDGRKPLWLIGMASSLILLLACVNVVTVFTASAIERRKELSIRLALGAARSVVLRQLFIQSLMFAVVGASLGLVVAKAGLVYLIHRFPYAVFRFKETSMDHTVVWFTVCMALGATLLSSILPGWYAAKLNINSELKGEWSWTPLSRYRAVGQGALIAFEVALAAGLVLVSGLLIKSFYELQKVDLGFNPHRMLTFEVSLPEAEYKDEAAKSAFYRQALQNLRAIPGVESASASYTLPLATGTHFINLQVDSHSPLAGERPFVDSTSVLPGFLTSMKVPILQGRDFTDADRAGSPPVAIVDDVLAAQMWPGQSAIGKRLRLADVTDNRPPWREIVGVVRQVKYSGPEGNVDRLQVYEPAYQNPPAVIYFVLDSTASIATLRSPVEKAIHDVAADLPVEYFQTLDGYLDQMEGSRKVALLLLCGFAAIGIALGMIGIYGVVSNSVARRRREIAIRMALGATVRSSIILVTRLGLLATLVGIAIGSVIVVCLTSVLSAFLFGVKALDPAIYLLSAIAIIVLAFIASLVPAAALLWVNPQDILRE
ncbi:MAG TPA: ABC transporter permease [Candidatus Angelobacter sp.]|nr:ABC transporter permease [Candidatus Angelobacter sp.]